MKASAQRQGSEGQRLPYVWDYDLDAARFRAILEGRDSAGRLDRDWAAVRLLEHASWGEIRRLMTLGEIVAGWPAWSGRIRSATRKRAFGFLAEWLPEHHPELL